MRRAWWSTKHRVCRTPTTLWVVCLDLCSANSCWRAATQQLSLLFWMLTFMNNLIAVVVGGNLISNQSMTRVHLAQLNYLGRTCLSITVLVETEICLLENLILKHQEIQTKTQFRLRLMNSIAFLYTLLLRNKIYKWKYKYLLLIIKNKFNHQHCFFCSLSFCSFLYSYGLYKFWRTLLQVNKKTNKTFSFCVRSFWKHECNWLSHDSVLLGVIIIFYVPTSAWDLIPYPYIHTCWSGTIIRHS